VFDGGELSLPVFILHASTVKATFNTSCYQDRKPRGIVQKLGGINPLKGVENSLVLVVVIVMTVDRHKTNDEQSTSCTKRFIRFDSVSFNSKVHVCNNTAELLSLNVFFHSNRSHKSKSFTDLL